MSALVAMRSQIGKVLVAVLWLHVPVVAVLGVVLSQDWLAPSIATAIFAGIATALWRADPQSPGFRYATAIAFVVQIAIMLYQLRGNPWQVDLHMYFFAALAMMAAFCD